MMFLSSQLLEELISTAFNGSWQELMGEFQLSFVVFLQLSSLAALDQWKQFVSILCSCESALRARLPLFLAFLKVFRTHLEQVSCANHSRSIDGLIRKTLALCG